MLREAAQAGSRGTNPGYYASCVWNHRRYPLFPFHKGEGTLNWNYGQAKSRSGNQLIFQALGENLFWNIHLHPYSKHVLKPGEKYPKPASVPPPAGASSTDLTPHTNPSRAALR